MVPRPPAKSCGSKACQPTKQSAQRKSMGSNARDGENSSCDGERVPRLRACSSTPHRPHTYKKTGPQRRTSNTSTAYSGNSPTLLPWALQFRTLPLFHVTELPWLNSQSSLAAQHSARFGAAAIRSSSHTSVQPLVWGIRT